MELQEYRDVALIPPVDLIVVFENTYILNLDFSRNCFLVQILQDKVVINGSTFPLPFGFIKNRNKLPMLLISQLIVREMFLR